MAGMSDSNQHTDRSAAVSAGMAAAAARGVRLGRPRKKPEAADRVNALRNAGLSLQQIADKLAGDKVLTPSGNGTDWRKASVQNIVAWLDENEPQEQARPHQKPGRKTKAT